MPIFWRHSGFRRNSQICLFEYISLAEELGVPLVTNDNKLQSHFPDIALSPKQFLED